jgi:hypothetical protein
MALDAEVLAELAFSKYQVNMREQHPEVLKNRTVRQVPLDDGSTNIEYDDETGPIEIKREDIMPLLSALAEAIVEHMNEHAEVRTVAAGTETRNIT